MGRATGLLSLGLVSWSIGGLIWAYYNFFGAVYVPYPSLADAAYVISWPLWAAGAIQLSRATGARFSLRSLKGKLLLITIPVLVSIVSYYLLITVARRANSTCRVELLKCFSTLRIPLVTWLFSLLHYLFTGCHSNILVDGIVMQFSCS